MCFFIPSLSCSCLTDTGGPESKSTIKVPVEESAPQNAPPKGVFELPAFTSIDASSSPPVKPLSPSTLSPLKVHARSRARCVCIRR